MKRLTSLGIKHATDKATYHLFTELYDDFFEKFDNPNILEIGVLRGASLRMYNEYYGEKCNIVGLDNGERWKYSGNESNIKIITGDQSKKEDLKKCVEAIKEYDIIIDDGSHLIRDQQISFCFLFDYVKKGGIYIIEDLHSSLNANYNPENTITTIGMLAQLDKGTYSSHSPYITKDDFNRLKKQIKNITISVNPIRRKEDGMTSVITKK